MNSIDPTEVIPPLAERKVIAGTVVSFEDAGGYDGAYIEIGPRTPSRAAIYAQAVELQALSRLAVEFTVPGPHADVPRALRQIARMRDVLGSSGTAGG